MRNLVAIGSVALGLLASQFVLRADDWNKKTYITVNQPILIPGHELMPGKYVLKLLNSSSDRHIVQVFNNEENHLIATILAFNNYRVEPTGKTVLTFWETPAGVPPALRGWFYPGDTWGQEFAYPKALAERIAAANRNVRPPSYEGPEAPAPKALASVPVQGVTPKPSPAEIAEAKKAPAPAEPANPPAIAERSEQNQTLAQNTAPAPQENLPAELPKTGTPMALIALSGLFMTGLAAKLSFRR